MKIRQRDNKLWISSVGSRSDTWKNISKHHLYKQWRKIINDLKERGFVITVPIYYIGNDWGHKTHKVGKKANGVCVVLELHETNIELEFGFKDNLWDSENNFWSYSEWDKRYTHLSYLNTKRVELELNKILPNIERDVDIRFKGADFIINDKKESCHSYKKEKLDELGLGGVEYQMSKYDLKLNSFDKNRKIIKCGDLKYFYDNKRLVCGYAYHNINNMWWVLCGGTVINMASFELFDYNGQPRRLCLSKEEKINKLKSVLRKLEESKNYLKCIQVDKQITKLTSSEPLYKVYSLKWGTWWGSNNSGYTSDESKAGLYLESNILANQSYYNNGVTSKAIKI